MSTISFHWSVKSANRREWSGRRSKDTTALLRAWIFQGIKRQRFRFAVSDREMVTRQKVWWLLQSGLCLQLNAGGSMHSPLQEALASTVLLVALMGPSSEQSTRNLNIDAWHLCGGKSLWWPINRPSYSPVPLRTRCGYHEQLSCVSFFFSAPFLLIPVHFCCAELARRVPLLRYTTCDLAVYLNYIVHFISYPNQRLSSFRCP